MPEPPERHFSGKQLRRAAREVSGLSREQLAVAIDRSWNSVYQYERGLLTPSTEALERMARLLSVGIDEFFERLDHV